MRTRTWCFMGWALLLSSALIGHAAKAEEAQFRREGTRPAAVESFDPHTFSNWRTVVRRPTWVVFTATWCAVCPAVISDLTTAAQQHPRKPLVWAVVIDAAPGEDDTALLGQVHLRRADRILAFDGPAQALRYSVDPGWRGAVPFVAVLSPKVPARFFLGKPPDAVLRN